jgi:hypothetical protein
MFPVGKGGRCVGHIHVPIVLKSGSLNLLEPSRPVKACNGIALSLPFISWFSLYLINTLYFQQSLQ